MAFNNRPNEDGNRTPGRRVFRSMPDFKRMTRDGNGRNNGKPAPPETTHAETYYYLKQMGGRTPMVIIMSDGEEIRGCIEWYDRTSLKVNREGAPNLVIQKQYIKYLFKQEELEK